MLHINESRIAAIFLTASLLFAAAIAGVVWLFLTLVGAPRPAPFLIFGALYLLASAPVLRAARPRFALCASVIFLAFLGVGLGLPWSERAQFIAAVDSIERGMSVAEVDSIMAGYIRGTGWPAPPWQEGATVASNGELRVAGCEVFRWSNEGAYNSDWGIVCFENGRVESADFHPD